jgi:hypothetical protein
VVKVKPVYIENIFKICLLLFWGAHCGIYKVVTICHMYHTWIHPLHHSPLFPPPHFWNCFNRYHFSIYIHVYTAFCTIFTLLHTFPTSFPLPHYQPPRQDLFCPPVLHFVKEKKDIFVCLRELCRKFPCGISVYISIVAWIGSSPLFFFFLP